MKLRVFNSLTGQKEEFKPIKEGEVSMYVCGVTVYDRCHLGHARAGIVFDFVYRALMYLGYKTTYVRNFTDVDDKIINRANERGISCEELVEENIKAFYDDMDALHLKRPTHEPRATQYIEAMQNLISTLIEKGMAYEAGGDVFFSVAKFSGYGKLSKKNIDDLMSGARVEVNESKKSPLDFALWKAAKPGEPKWDSPWGEGRPGWHIECSAMGRELLGETFDIHGGGKDLVFPHHENEIAQSQGASGKKPVNYWMHNGFVNINKEKMSKSLGNFFTINDILKKFDAETVRLYLLSTHYRSPTDFADGYLKDAETHLDRMYATLARAGAVLGENPEVKKTDVDKSAPYSEYEKKFKEALYDDFNSASAIALINEAANNMNALCDRIERKKGNTAENANNLKSVFEWFRGAGKGVLGLFNRVPDEYLASMKKKRLAEIGMTEDEVEKLIEKRKAARAQKDFAQSDTIRDELTAKGIVLYDSAQGTTWTVAVK